MKHNEFIVSAGSKYEGRICPVSKLPITPGMPVVICAQSDTALSELVFREQAQCPICHDTVVLASAQPPFPQQPPVKYRSMASPMATTALAAIGASAFTLTIVLGLLLATNVISLPGTGTAEGMMSAAPTVAPEAEIFPTDTPPAAASALERSPEPPPALIATEPVIAPRVVTNLIYLATAQATSVLPPEQTASFGLVSFDPVNVLDRNPASSWVEGVQGPGYGERLVLTFPAPVEVTQFGIVVGYDRDEEIFFANHRLRRARLEFDNGTGLVVEFQDQRGMQRINIPPTLTQTIAIVIEDVYSGARYDDTPIAEVEIWGNAP